MRVVTGITTLNPPNPLFTHRTERYEFELLNENDVLLRPLRGVRGGVIEQNVNATIRGGGSLEINDLGQNIKWSSDRFRIWYSTASMRWPLGVYLISQPIDVYTSTGLQWSVKMMDKLSVLDEDAVANTFALPNGQNVTDAIRVIIQSAGETSQAITDSPETLKSSLVWEAGTSKLRIINDLLDAINYFSLWCDGLGQYRVEPYTRPQDRPVMFSFIEGPQSIHTPNWDRDQDLSKVPNMVVLVSQGDTDTESLVSSFSNIDPASPFSIPSRGRTIVHREDGVEATSQAVLDGMAARRLMDISSSVANINFQHAMVDIDLNAKVLFRSQGHETHATLQKKSIELRPGSLIQATLREVGL